jgi:hypothetical protein
MITGLEDAHAFWVSGFEHLRTTSQSVEAMGSCRVRQMDEEPQWPLPKRKRAEADAIAQALEP